MFEVNIYLETTIKGPSKMNGTYGYIIEFMGKEEIITREAFSFVENTTANQIIIMALIRALGVLTKPCQIIVHADSDYLSNTINQNRIKTWSLKEWISAKGKEVKNKSLWQIIEKQLETHIIQVVNEKKHAYTDWMQAEIRKGTT